MSVYDDAANVKVLQLSQNGSNAVNISVDCYHGTQSQVAFKKNGATVTVGCGETEAVGTVASLRGQTIIFSGAAGNPNGGEIKAVHTVSEQNGNSVTYTFPDDYTETPAFDPTDQDPSYLFYIKFI